MLSAADTDMPPATASVATRLLVVLGDLGVAVTEILQQTLKQLVC